MPYGDDLGDAACTPSILAPAELTSRQVFPVAHPRRRPRRICRRQPVQHPRTSIWFLSNPRTARFRGAGEGFLGAGKGFLGAGRGRLGTIGEPLGAGSCPAVRGRFFGLGVCTPSPLLQRASFLRFFRGSFIFREVGNYRLVLIRALAWPVVGNRLLPTRPGPNHAGSFMTGPTSWIQFADSDLARIAE